MLDVRQGDLYIVDNQLTRVFYIDSAYVFIVGMDVYFIEKYDAGQFLKDVNLGIYQKQADMSMNSQPELSEADIQKITSYANALDAILDELYPEWEKITKPRFKKPYLKKTADVLGIHQKHVTRLLKRYLQSGRDKYSLVDGRLTSSSSTEVAVTKTMQTAFDDETSVDEMLQEALTVFKKTKSVTAAHHHILEHYFMMPSYNEGKMTFALMPQEKILSYQKVYRFINANLGGKTIKEYIKGDRDFRNNNRLLSGNARTGLVSIGQLFQLDECEVGVTIVSERDPDKVIGKPIVHCAFDPVANIIVGINIGLKNNSYSGFCDLMMTMLEPHENQTSLVDVHCTDDVFPSMILPKEIRADHGAEYESQALMKAARELGIKVQLVPVAAGSYKGGVENVFMRLQHILKITLQEYGYILPENNGGKNARKKACLTLKDMRQIIYKIVLDLNQANLPGYSMSREMMEAGVAPTPVAIWDYHKKNGGLLTTVTESNRQTILFSLLSQADKKRRFKLSRAGVEYVGHTLRFFSDEEWFALMLRDKNAEVDIRYDDQSVDVIYLRYQKEIHCVPLAVRREELASFKGMSWYEYDELYKYQKSIKNDHAALERRLNTEREVKQIARNAQVLQAEEQKARKNDVKNIKENRKVEQMALQAGDQETRNRLLTELDDRQVIPASVIQARPEPVEILSYDSDDDDLLDLIGDDEE